MRSGKAKRCLFYALLMATLLFSCPSLSFAQQQSADTEQLGMALEYFQASKYHEALMLFQKLDKQYKLNPRFRAYIALCYYYEWDYKTAVKYFDKVLPELKGLSPHELSVYYYAAGESYFQLQKYDKSMPYFQKALKVCYDRDKGDIYYRIGLMQMFDKEWGRAYESYSQAERYYKQNNDTTALVARLAQISNMKRGCLPGVLREIDRERSRMLNAPDDANSASSATQNQLSPWSDSTLFSKNAPIIWK